jgi:hypothetical protein
MEFQDQPANPTEYLPPRGDTESRAAQIKANLHQDMHTTAVSNGLTDMPSLIDALCDDAMFQIEHLLVEIETLRSASVTEDLGWPRD